MRTKIKENKSCYISDNVVNKIVDIKQTIKTLIRLGVAHFYFTKNAYQTTFVKNLRSYEKTAEISINFVHDYKKPFWHDEDVSNLPILIENGKKEDDFFDEYLKRYSDIVIEK